MFQLISPGSCRVSIRVSVVIRPWSQPTGHWLGESNLFIRSMRLSRSEGDHRGENYRRESSVGDHRGKITGGNHRGEVTGGSSPIDPSEGLLAEPPHGRYSGSAYRYCLDTGSAITSLGLSW